MIKRLVCFAIAVAFSGPAFAQVAFYGDAHNANTIRYATQDHVSQYFLGTGFNCNTDNKVWANWVTSEIELDMQFGSIKYKTNGIQVGADLYSNKTTLIGLVGGYESSVMEYNGVDAIDVDDYYFGVYGTKLFSNCVDMRAYAGYGSQRYEDSFYSDNYKGKTFETTLEFGRRYHLNRCWSFRPFVGLDWYTNNVQFDSFWNEELTQVMGRFGSDLQYTRGNWNLNGGLHYAYQLNESALYNTFALNGLDLGRSVLTLTAGTTVYLDECKKWSLFATYYGDCYVDREGTRGLVLDKTPWRHTAMIGTGYRF